MGQEVREMRVYDIRVFQDAQVPGPGNALQPGVGKAGVQPLGAAHGKSAIRFSNEHEGRYVDVLEGRVERVSADDGVCHVLDRGMWHEADVVTEVAYIRQTAQMGAQAEHERRNERQKRCEPYVLGAPPEGSVPEVSVQRCRTAVGIEQGQPRHPVRMGQRGAQGDHATERESAPGGLPDVEVIQDGDDVVDGVVQREVLFHRSGFPVTPQIDVDHAESLREHGYLVLPHPPVEQEAVQEHDRWTVALDLEEDFLILVVCCRHELSGTVAECNRTASRENPVDHALADVRQQPGARAFVRGTS